MKASNKERCAVGIVQARQFTFDSQECRKRFRGLCMPKAAAGDTVHVSTVDLAVDGGEDVVEFIDEEEEEDDGCGIDWDELRAVDCPASP